MQNQKFNHDWLNAARWLTRYLNYAVLYIGEQIHLLLKNIERECLKTHRIPLNSIFLMICSRQLLFKCSVPDFINAALQLGQAFEALKAISYLSISTMYMKCWSFKLVLFVERGGSLRRCFLHSVAR